MNAKKFLIRLFILFFSGYLTLHILTISIDPYQLGGINFVNKYAGGHFDRFGKPLSLDKMGDDFKMFIIGSSRSRNFKPVMVEKLSEKKTYNYSLINGSLEDYIAAFNHIVQTQKPEIIYLQLDFYTFNETHSTRSSILNTPLEKYLSPFVDLERGATSDNVPLFFDTTYFSLAALIDAYKCLNLFLENRKKEVPLGDFIVQPPDVLHKDGISSSSNAENEKVRVLNHYFSLPNNNNYPYYNFGIDERQVSQSLGFIKRMAEENKVKLIIALSPVNKEHLEVLFSDPKLTKYWFRVKKILVRSFPSYYDFNNCSVDAFRGPKFWLDSVHMTPKLAEIMMSVVLKKTIGDKIPTHFGFQVTSENLNNYLLNLKGTFGKPGCPPPQVKTHFQTQPQR
jgi:hypothetical protein